MKLDTNKERGKAGLSMAIAYFGANGYTVSLPLNDTQDYDLIIDDGKSLKKVQVKCTCYKEYGSYVIPLRSCGGTKGTVYKRVLETDIDILFALCGDGTMYVIPKEDIKATNSLYVRKERSKYSNGTDYSKYIVTF